MNRRPTKGTKILVPGGKRTRIILKKDEDPVVVYVGPTVEGPDAEYIKIVSGKVDVRKPSFV